MKLAFRATSVFVLAVFSFFMSVQTANAIDEQGVDSLTQLNKTVTLLDKAYAAGSIQTLMVAEQALSDSDSAKINMQKWYLQSELACYEKFFVTYCLNGIKLIRRNNNDILQRIAVEAKALQRRQHIEELDEKLKEKNASQ
ncbi:MAG: hypothetical protein H7252_08020 [Cytophaga sp.]|nr:hypothetical protein [Undibacterium sp.]